MRDLTANFTAEKNKEQNKPIFLYKIFAYDGTNNLLYAEYDEDVTFDSEVFSKFPISHEYIQENTTGEVPGIRVKVSNISRLIQAYLEQYDFRGLRVDIISVFANKINEPTTKTFETLYIDSITANEVDVEFMLTTKSDTIERQVPFGKYMRTHCRWKFKGTECAYAGAETTCNRTLQRCRVLENQLRFGGFPSVPFRKIYVAG